MDFRSTSVGQIKENCGFRESWNCGTVQAMFVCIIYGTVVTETEFKGDFDTVTRTACVPTTFAQRQTPAGLWGGMGEPRNSEIVKQHSSDHTVWCTNGTEVIWGQGVPWHRHEICTCKHLHLQCNKIIYKVTNLNQFALGGWWWGVMT